MNKRLLFSCTVLPLAILPMAVVASCSQGDTTNQRQEFELEQALQNAVNTYENMFYQNAGTNASTSGISYLQKTAPHPKNNYGFTTKLEAITPEDESQDADDNKGTKKAKLTVSRPDGLTKSKEIEIKGFLSKSQEDSERSEPSVNIWSVLSGIPTHQINLKTKLKDQTASEVLDMLKQNLSEEELAKVININRDNATAALGSLFKEQKAEGVKVNVLHARKVKEGSMDVDALNVVIQLVKGDKKSRYVELLIEGFKEDKSIKTKENLEKWTSVYETLFNPVEASQEGDTIPEATKIKSLADLKPFLSPAYQSFGKIKVKLNDKITKQNDQLGSITIEAEFTYKTDDLNVGTIKKEIVLYGFKVVSPQ